MNQQSEDYTLLLASMVMAAIVALLMLHHSKKKDRMRRKLSEARKTQLVPKNIIILAVQIANFIVFFSERFNPKYKVIANAEKSLAVRIGNFLTNVRPCFFERFTRKAIRKFFRDINAIQNLKLVLYTHLQKEIACKILQDLNIQNCFEEKDRIYTRAEFKFAQVVDPDTGRVIILSANRQDLDRSVTSHHGLILELGKGDALLEENILNDLKDCFVTLAQKGRVDTLHEDMHILTNRKGLPVFDDDAF